MNVASPLRLVPVFPPGRLGAEVLDRGGRCFAVRHAGATLDGDVLVAVPQAAAANGGASLARQLIVPRGLGRPLLARATPTGWAVDGSGESCSPRRWVTVGGLAARVRTVRLPLGPAAAVSGMARREPGGSVMREGPWLAVRPVAPGWAAACRVDASVGRGPVAVLRPVVANNVRAARRLASVSPEARALGVVPGMSLRLATRRCPALRAVEAPSIDVVEELRTLLGAEIGDVSRQGRALLVALPAGKAAEHVALAEALVVRAWQAIGLHLRVAVAAERRTAAQVSGLLDADQVAYVPLGAAGAWRRRARRAVRREGGAVRWEGAELVDVEGVVALARALVERKIAPGSLHVSSSTGRYTVRCPEGKAVGAHVEEALRARGPRLDGAAVLEWRPRAARAGEQVRLIEEARLAR